MRQSSHRSKALWLIGGVVALTGCGGGDGGDGAASGDGTVTEQWASFCTGVFTEDTPIVDAFDRSTFTARVGAEFLLSDFSDTFGGRAEFLYLTNVGPDTFDLKPNADGAWPFTSNCTINQGVPYYGVFDSVSVFSEKELKTKICDLSEGTVLPAGTAGRGYGFSGASGSSAIYEVILGPFSTQCGGLQKGFVRVPQTTSFDSTTYLVPIAGLIGPE